uniref:PDZ domain-containing protein n=1 Tax=Sus scrofa TaxID=9823 RepID=A0A8D1MLV6_PIG
MSKTLKKKKHWLSKVQECAVSWAGPPGDLGAEIRGGAERGEFPYLGRLREEPGGGTCCVVSGKAPSPGDVLLEVNGTPVSGLTNRDTLAVIRHFREPIRLKTVKPGTLALPLCLGAMARPGCHGMATRSWVSLICSSVSHRSFCLEENPAFFCSPLWKRSSRL